MKATWLADVLRAEGLEVVECAGWRTRGHYASEGDFTDLRAVVWHHDASAPGDSPGVPSYMLSNWSKAGAQLWVDRRGVWHILAAGVAFHAGKVLSGMPGNRQSLGVETDHTTGEDWPPALLSSLQRGTAAILRRLDKPAKTGLHFHKTICSPKGRKSDPDGLNLLVQRAYVQSLIDQHTPSRNPQEDPLMALTDADVTKIAKAVYDLTCPPRLAGRKDRDGTHITPSDIATMTEDLKTLLSAARAEIRSLRAEVTALRADPIDPTELDASVTLTLKPRSAS